MNGLGGSVRALLAAFNGTQTLAQYLMSGTNAALATQPGIAMASPPPMWSQANVPVAANTQATTSKAAGGAGVRHVCWGISATFDIVSVGAVNADPLVYLRDGAASSGTIIWRTRLGSAGGVAGQQYRVDLTGLCIVGSANTAMTLEFANNGGANTFESVALTGFSIPA
jgi:hypothetical protein